MITKPTVIDGQLWLPGEGSRHAPIMLIAPCVDKDEIATERPIGKQGDRMLYQKIVPHMLQCAQGMYLKDTLLKSGINPEKDIYYTTIIKYLPENIAHRSRPIKKMIKDAWSYLDEEIKTIKPKVIACMGKHTFDQFVSFRAKESDVRGYWFTSEEYKCKIFLVPTISNILRADKHESFMLAFDAIRSMLDTIKGIEVNEIPIRGRVIETAAQLREWVAEMEKEEVKVFSVDCEWGGHQHVDGRLRSLQIAWSESDAIYIRFRDEEENYVFDVDYKEAGGILGRWLNREEVKYIGHHLSVDLTWMHHWLHLNWYRKGLFDTEFAEQCCNESLSLGLDDLALRYTTFGKYDWDLIAWKKEHPDLCTDGYGKIPDKILIPYGWKDVLTVYRAWPILKKKLEQQELMEYYENILNPLVTTVTTFFCLQGLPIDRAKIDEMRELYNWAKRELTIDFQRAITEEADSLFKQAMIDIGKKSLWEAVEELIEEGEVDTAEKKLKEVLGPSEWAEIEPIFLHDVNAPNFNDRSKPQMMRWLFQVKKYEPIKTTPNKEKGMPSIEWTKVKTFPEEIRIQYTPATDVQTLEILAAKHDDQTIRQLLMLNAVGNICKSFLKPAELDEDGNVVKEEGLHFWITSDDRICLNHSTTRSSRLRSFNPNALNWPSYIGVKLGTAITEIIKKRHKEKKLPKKWGKYVDTLGKDFPTIRGICMARPGWCMVEADFRTAEMRGLAYISGDKQLKKLINDPDDCFALVKPVYLPEGIAQEDCTVRLKFPDYIKFPEDKDKYVMTYTVEGNLIKKFSDEELLRDKKGNICHPRYDMHWTTAEMSRHTCREVMNKKKDRGAAKIVSFSASYGGTALSIARKIESDTGIKVTEEEAQAFLDAIDNRQPRATIFLHEMEEKPAKGELYVQAASGRKMHIQVLQRLEGTWTSARKDAISSLGRECRNYLMQESVGATAAIACTKIVDFTMRYRNSVCKLRGYPIVCLYDSIVIHCPVEERHLWEKVLELYMHAGNGWYYEGDILRYPIDCEINAGWSTKATGEIAEKLKEPGYMPVPERLKEVEELIDHMIEFYNRYPEVSVYNRDKIVSV